MLDVGGRTGTALPVCPNICKMVTGSQVPVPILLNIYSPLVHAERVARLRALVHDTIVSLVQMKRVATPESPTFVTDPTFFERSI